MMFNLLRFPAVADYPATPDLAQATPISGEQPCLRHIVHTTSLLERSGGQELFLDRAHTQLIRPSDEHREATMLACHHDANLAFALDPAATQGLYHQTAALADSHLLPPDKGF